jgi:hypothetical protein
MFFLLEEVAVPHVLFSAGPRAHGVTHGGSREMGRPVVMDCYRWQEATLGADQVHDWAGHPDFGFSRIRRVLWVEIQVIEASLRAVNIRNRTRFGGTLVTG